MPELEQQLYDLGASLAWPATPAHSWAPRAARSGAVLGGVRVQPRWALVAAAALLLVAAALAAYPPSRNAIAGWLNLHTNVIRVQHPPTPSVLPSGRLGSDLSLGDRTTLQAARDDLAWPIAVPGSRGAPDAVYVQKTELAPSAGEVTLVYGSRAGIPVSRATGVSVLVTEARGRVDEVYFQKMLGGGASIQQVDTGGRPAYWITGAHDFVFVDSAGNVRFETLRLATNTLVLDRGGVIVRIEGDLTRDQALALARSLS